MSSKRQTEARGRSAERKGYKVLFCLLLAALCLLSSGGAALAQMAGGRLYNGTEPLYGPRPDAGATQNGLPQALREVKLEQRLNEQAPLDLQFRDEAGASVRLGQYFTTKPVILALVFYECKMLCTEVLNGLTGSLKAQTFDVGKEFEVVTVSFDPRETPKLAAAKKQSYMERYGRAGAERGWHFLTGDAENIRRLTEAVGFHYTYDTATNQFAHASGIMLLTPQGRLARYFYGVEYAPKDLKFGLMEASENRIGSAVDQLLLYCYHYDPATGRYGPAIMKIMRLGGIVTVLGIGLLLVVLRRRGAAGAREMRLSQGGTA
ncbi:MAG TPA: SCO family protein [Pyrinomonadaceae bacterium]